MSHCDLNIWRIKKKVVVLMPKNLLEPGAFRGPLKEFKGAMKDLELSNIFPKVPMNDIKSMFEKSILKHQLGLTV